MNLNNKKILTEYLKYSIRLKALMILNITKKINLP